MRYSEEGERGYIWFFFHPNHQWKLCLLVSLVILALSLGFFLWCTHVSDDLGGDSFAGLVFAVGSTVFLFLAAVSFSLQRRAPQRTLGKLNAVLNWHVCFAVIALVMVFLHAFDNLNPRTGTYALYGMIALVISGAIGRVLDRMMPFFIAREVGKALTTRGEDRIESMVEKLQSLAAQEQRRHSQLLQSGEIGPAFADKREASIRQDSLSGIWDMGYISLEKVPSSEGRHTGQYRLGTRQKSTPVSSGPISSVDIRQPLNTIEEVQQAFEREVFFRSVIRYWRLLHIILAVVTVGLTLWHIEYALSLIIPAVQKFGFSYLFPWP